MWSVCGYVHVSAMPTEIKRVYQVALELPGVMLRVREESVLNH